MLSCSLAFLVLTVTLIFSCYYDKDPHSTSKETEAQRGKVISSKLPSQEVERKDLNPALSNSYLLPLGRRIASHPGLTEHTALSGYFLLCKSFHQ